MKTDEYQIGDRIYYTGDMANQSGFGIITKRYEYDRFAPVTYDIHFDDGREFKGVYYLGFEAGAGRRFWLLSEWQTERKVKEDAFIARMKEFVKANK